jgi:hypothetical protein
MDGGVRRSLRQRTIPKYFVEDDVMSDDDYDSPVEKKKREPSKPRKQMKKRKKESKYDLEEIADLAVRYPDDYGLEEGHIELINKENPLMHFKSLQHSGEDSRPFFEHFKVRSIA